MRAIKEKVDSYDECPYGEYTIRVKSEGYGSSCRLVQKLVGIMVGDDNCKGCLWYKGEIKNKHIHLHLCESRKEREVFYPFILIEKKDIIVTKGYFSNTLSSVIL